MPSIFKLQISNFTTYLKKGKSLKAGKMLRFDVSWRIDIPPVNPGIDKPVRLGMTLRGCLAFVSIITGELHWHPTQVKNMSWHNVAVVTPDLYEQVKVLIENSPYYGEIAPPRHEVWRNAEELKPSRWEKVEKTEEDYEN